MIATYSILALIVCLIIVLIFFTVRNVKTKDNQGETEIKTAIETLSKDINRIDSSLKDGFKTNREEFATSAKAGREELAGSIKSMSESLSKALLDSFNQQKNLLDTFSSSLDNLTKTNNERFDHFIKTLESKLTELKESHTESDKEARKELKLAFESFKTDLQNTLNNYKDAQRESFENFSTIQKNQNVASAEKLVEMRQTIEKSIGSLQEGNEKKLEEMRNTVDEKLQKTLETRLGESFKLVSERLEAVHKGLGDMQQLATGVGDLKKVLSNVKTRGILGEYQLENILEQMLTPEQYGKNIKTKEGSNALVEFAIKLPGKENSDKPLWIPIDAKFPREDYEVLHDAYEKGDLELIEEARKSFTKGIRKFAQDINAKYIDPPNTTDFAILFLPFESLYAEALRAAGLFESIQRELKVIITGPTTLSAILTSLQMGFRTLAIEKRSSEVWDILGLVKKEFAEFGGLIDKTEKKLQEATNTIKKVGVRNRALNRSLKSVEELPQEKIEKLLEDFNLHPNDTEETDESESEV